MAVVTYVKGPLGYAVLVDGKAVGSIKDRRPHGYTMRLDGVEWDTPVGSLAAHAGVKKTQYKYFAKLKDAMAEANEKLGG